jgi:hypothetical protein
LKKLICLLFLIATTKAIGYDFPKVPLPEVGGSICTTYDKDFDHFRYPEQIPYCKRNVSSNQKRNIYIRDGVPLQYKSQYTVDHLISLSVGGTNHNDNLWAEHKSIKNHRGSLEYDNYLMLREGLITQADAVMVLRDSKLDPDLLQKPHYNSYGSYWNYVKARGLDLEKTPHWSDYTEIKFTF